MLPVRQNGRNALFKLNIIALGRKTMILAEAISILALSTAVAAVVFSWLLWRTDGLWDQSASGLALGAALGGLVGVYAGELPLGMLLGAIIGGACGLILYVLQSHTDGIVRERSGASPADLIASSLTLCIALGAFVGAFVSGPPLGIAFGSVAGGAVALIFCVLRT